MPSFLLREKRLLAEQILVKGFVDSDLNEAATLCKILDTELRSLEAVRLGTDPLLRVAVYPASIDGMERCYVTLGEPA